MALQPPHEKEQISAIEINLATARDYIQDDLKAKFGHGENIFFDLDLIEYRINNSCLDIAEDLDVKSLYGLTTDDVAENSVGRAFRGHHNEDFKPEYQFNGLFSEEMNDMIEGIRYEKVGRKALERGDGIHAHTPEERIEIARNGGRKAYEQGIGIHAQTPEERIELGRKGNEAQGFHVFSLEELVDIANFREESIGKGRYKMKPCWKDTTSKMNEKYGEDWSTSKIKDAYRRNKNLLTDEEE